MKIYFFRWFVLCVLLTGMWLCTACRQGEMNDEPPTEMEYRLDSLFQMGMSLRGFEEEQMKEITQEIHRLANLSGSKAWQSRAFFLSGMLHMRQANYAIALDQFYRSLGLAMELDDLHYIARLYQFIGSISQVMGNYTEAIDNFLRASRYFEQAGILDDKYRVGLNTGMMYLQLENYDRARNHIWEAYQHFLDRGMVNEQIACLHGMGQYHAAGGQLDSAMVIFSRVMDMSRYEGNRYYLSMVFHSIGEVHMKANQIDLARSYFLKSDSLAAEHLYTSQQATARLGLARLESSEGNHRLAREYADKAYRVALNLNNALLLQGVYEVLSSIHENMEDLQQALEYHKKSATLGQELINQEMLHQIYNLEIRELSNEREMQRFELQQQRIQLDRSRSRSIIVTLMSVSTIIIMVLLYYVYLTRMRTRQKRELDRTRLSVMQKRAQITLEAELSERQRLGMELHDGVGPLLSLARMNLQMLQDRPDLPADRKAVLLNNTESTVEEVLKEMKNISRNMVPVVLLEKGFEAAIRDLVKRLNNLEKYRVNVNFSGKDWKLEPYMAHTLFRAVQEVLNNSIIHSQCREITLQAIQTGDEITLMIEDDGIGFDPMVIQEKKGLGLNGAASRIRSLKGEFLIDSVAGRGTIITILIPFKQL